MLKLFAVSPESLETFPYKKLKFNINLGFKNYAGSIYVVPYE